MNSNTFSLTINELEQLIHFMEADFLKKFSLNKITTGFELEFYLSPPPIELFTKISTEIQKVEGVLEFKHELGTNLHHTQFEITTIPQNNLINSCQILENIRTQITNICHQNNTEISFKAITSENLPPSSLQLNCCFWEENAQTPISHTNPKFQDIMQKMVHFIIDTTLLTSPTANCITRICNTNFVEQFKNSPTNQTWGIENRTVAIRIAHIPNAKTQNRLEIRTPSAIASPYNIAIAFFASTLCESSTHYTQTFIDSHISNSKPLPKSLKEALELFQKSEINKKIKKYLTQIWPTKEF